MFANALGSRLPGCEAPMRLRSVQSRAAVACASRDACEQHDRGKSCESSGPDVPEHMPCRSSRITRSQPRAARRTEMHCSSGSNMASKHWWATTGAHRFRPYAARNGSKRFAYWTFVDWN